MSAATIFGAGDAPALGRDREQAGVAQRVLLARKGGQHMRRCRRPTGSATPRAAAGRCRAAPRHARPVPRTAAPPRRSSRRSRDRPGHSRGSGCRRSPAAHPVLDAVEVDPAVGRQRIGVAVVGPRQHVQHQRRVAHVARHRPDIRQQAHRRRRIGRHPAERRLDAEDAGEGGRDADRAGAVAADMQRRRCRRRRRRRRRRCCRPGCARGSTGCG